MTRVWLAEEPAFAGRQVAIKEPRENPLPDDLAELRRRFQREVQVSALLAQSKVPNIGAGPHCRTLRRRPAADPGVHGRRWERHPWATP